MNDTTWVKLYRKSLANEVRRRDPTAWRLFETLLLLVDSQTGKWSGGRYQLVDADGYLNSSTIYKALKRLQKRGMILQSSNTRYTEISICKFSNYALNGNTSGKNEVKTREKPGNTLTRSKKLEVRSIDTKVSKSSSDELDSAHKWISALFEKDASRFKLTPKRKQKLKLRLNELGRDRFKQAYHAIAASNWHRGDNERGWKIDDDPYWLLGSAELAEKWANKFEEVEAASAPIDLSKVEIKV